MNMLEVEINTFTTGLCRIIPYEHECDCGAKLSGRSTAELFESLREHYMAAHDKDFYEANIAARTAVQ